MAEDLTLSPPLYILGTISKYDKYDPKMYYQIDTQ